MNNFYVYAYLREDMYSPYYIGKGCARRIDNLHGNTARPPRNRRVKIREGLTEEEAYQIEKLYILMWGRESEGGVLENNAAGGGANATQLRWHYEDKSRYIGENGSMYGKKHSEETKELIRQKTLAQWEEQGHPWKGRKHSPESRAKMRAARARREAAKHL